MERYGRDNDGREQAGREVIVERLEVASAADAARALSDRPGLAWLDGDGSPGEGRFSYVASDPVEHRVRTFADARPLEALRTLGRADDGDPGAPRAPRWIGYLAYDAAWTAPHDGQRGAMRRGHSIVRDTASQVLHFARYDAVVAVEHATGETWLIGDDRAACERLRERLKHRGASLEFAVRDVNVPSAKGHLDAIARALEHIRAGDIYQVNLARCWRAVLAGATREGAALGLYLAMRRASPVPLGAYLDLGDHAVLACTMERFLDWDGTTLVTRPIKGTLARRGGDANVEAEALRTDAKEHAEHSMIVDLMRNDLGRIAETGSVRVTHLLEVERYAGLSHLVSTVVGTTRA